MRCTAYVSFRGKYFCNHLFLFALYLNFVALTGLHNIPQKGEKRRGDERGWGGKETYGVEAVDSTSLSSAALV